MSQVEPSESDRESNNNVIDKNSRNSSALTSRKSSGVTIVTSGSGLDYGVSGSGLDYGVVNVVPNPPPLPSQPLTHFPSNPSEKYRPAGSNVEITENRRKSILTNGSATRPSMTSDINIITAPSLMEKPILPGIYK